MFTWVVYVKCAAGHTHRVQIASLDATRAAKRTETIWPGSRVRAVVRQAG